MVYFVPRLGLRFSFYFLFFYLSFCLWCRCCQLYTTWLLRDHVFVCGCFFFFQARVGYRTRVACSGATAGVGQANLKKVPGAWWESFLFLFHATAVTTIWICFVFFLLSWARQALSVRDWLLQSQLTLGGGDVVLVQPWLHVLVEKVRKHYNRAVLSQKQEKSPCITDEAL